MSEMVDRVARALYESEWQRPLDLAPDEDWETYRLISRTAIAAMRDSTDAMTKAIADAVMANLASSGHAPIRWDVGWKIMVDAALAETQ